MAPLVPVVAGQGTLTPFDHFGGNNSTSTKQLNFYQKQLNLFQKQLNLYQKQLNLYQKQLNLYQTT